MVTVGSSISGVALGALSPPFIPCSGCCLNFINMPLCGTIGAIVGAITDSIGAFTGLTAFTAILPQIEGLFGTIGHTIIVPR